MLNGTLSNVGKYSLGILRKASHPPRGLTCRQQVALQAAVLRKGYVRGARASIKVERRARTQPLGERGPGDQAVGLGVQPDAPATQVTRKCGQRQPQLCTGAGDAWPKRVPLHQVTAPLPGAACTQGLAPFPRLRPTVEQQPDRRASRPGQPCWAASALARVAISAARPVCPALTYHHRQVLGTAAKLRRTVKPISAKVS